jgi:pyruvate formate lyase activating enzyme
MQYFRYKNEQTITCLLCKHYCDLKESKTGICGVNINQEGKLKNLTYAHPSALNLDPIEKKPLYHFLPSTISLSLGTVGCNFRCPFCQNHSISQTSTINKKYTLPPASIVELALKHNAKSISYTYNEPIIWYPYAKDIGVLVKRYGLKNVFVTSGYESDEVIEDMKGWVDGANIDLKSFSSSYYKKVLKASLDGVLDSIKKLSSFLHVEVTTLVIPGVNDSKEELYDMASFLYDEVGSDTIWHLSAFHPDFKMNDTPRTPIETLSMAKEIAKDVGLEYVYIGNVKNDNSTYCSRCNELLIKRDYYSSTVLNLDTNKSTCKTCGEIIKGVWK